MLTKKPILKLVGQDGNAFMLIALARQAARKAGWPADKIADVVKEMMSGNYDKVLTTACKHFDVR